MGSTINGSRSWIQLGGMSIQPAEFAKLAVVIGMALLVAERTEGSLRAPQRGRLPRRGRDARDRRPARGADPAPARPGHHAGAVRDRLRRASPSPAPAAPGCSGSSSARSGRRRSRSSCTCSRPTSSTGSWRSRTPTSTRAAPATTPPRPGSRSATAASSARACSAARRPSPGFVPEQHTDFIFTVAGEELGLVGSAAADRAARRGAVAGAAHRDARRRPVRPGRRRRHRLLVRLPGLPEHRHVPRASCRSPAYPCRSCRTAAARCSRA